MTVSDYPPIQPFGGFGLGLRRTHYDDFLTGDVPVDFVEVISENYMIEGGRQMRILEAVRAKLPVIIHGVSMSIGSARGLDEDYLANLLQESHDRQRLSPHPTVRRFRPWPQTHALRRLSNR